MDALFPGPEAVSKYFCCSQHVDVQVGLVCSCHDDAWFSEQLVGKSVNNVDVNMSTLGTGKPSSVPKSAGRMLLCFLKILQSQPLIPFAGRQASESLYAMFSPDQTRQARASAASLDAFVAADHDSRVNCR